MIDLDCIPRPSVDEIRDRILAEYSERVLGGRAVPDGDFMHLAAYIWAGAAWQVYGDQALAIRGAIDFDHMCCDDLISRAKAYGLPPRASTQARGWIEITGTAEATIPGDIEFVSSGDDGAIEYQLSDLVVNATALDDEGLNTGKASILVEAKTPGSIGNLVSGKTMTLIGSVTGINATATVSVTGIDGGAEEETCDELRARLKLRRAEATVAGNRAWYTNAVLSYPGVTRVCWTGCQCSNCCAMPMTGYVWMSGAFPNGAPDKVLRAVEDYVWGSPMGVGAGLAPAGDYGQLLTPRGCPVTVNIHHTAQLVNAIDNARISAAFADFFASRTCVGETICGSDLASVLLSIMPSNCFARVSLSGECVDEINDGRDYRMHCGTYPTLQRVAYLGR